MKQCSVCKETKSFENFVFIRLNKDGSELRRAKCTDCYNRHYREKHQNKTDDERRHVYQTMKEKTTFDSRKNYRLNNRFGITLSDFNDRLKSQDNKCYICGSEFANPRAAKVDHDHETGKVRKLLCHPCNISLGLLKEDLTILQNCINYIQEHND